MRIKRIQISGFRGIPPVDPPNVDITLTSQTGEIKDLLLFGPNAYGKSSIADALEWFFKEKVRGGTYYEEYSNQDNIHIKTGQPNFRQEAYIELMVEHNNTDFVVRKEMDISGNKTLENLGGIQPIFEQLKDEIIVLDHDQFRNFVAAANDQKWATFASLIGFEELDQFRAGIDSLSSRSITDYLQKGPMEREVNSKRQQLSSQLQQALLRFEVQGQNFDDLKTFFWTKLEVTLSSLNFTIPNEQADLNEHYWENLKKSVRLPESSIKASMRLGELKTLLDKLSPFDIKLFHELDNLLVDVDVLERQKEYFDKEILAQFYKAGLQIIHEHKTPQDHCPFCQTAYSWGKLLSEVEKRNEQLKFDEIQILQKRVDARWKIIKQQIASKNADLASVDITAVKDAYARIRTLAPDELISLSTFNAKAIGEWVSNIKILIRILEENHKTVSEEIVAVTKALGENPLYEIQTAIDNLYDFWRTLEDLQIKIMSLNKAQLKLDVTSQIVDELRAVTGNFRSELSDFSGRVTEIINTDVKAYYDELHPKDDVRPFLEVSVRGNQRIVNLRCNYKGVPNKSAVSLLSESHRNSLGMSILLAFMKYKRQTGSPVGFCIFDDVTQSFDVEHRTNLLNFLENAKFPEISQQQILFFTHDRTLADLIKRSGDQQERQNWLRVDIRHWWLERMLLESENDAEPLSRAEYYANNNDEIAAAIYARRALEHLYKKIITKAQIKVVFSEKPWKIELNDYRQYILGEIRELWTDQKGFIDPNDGLFQQLFMSQRILNLTVHDSEFLESPMTLGDVQSAIGLIRQLDARFKCPNCGKPYHTIKKERGNNPTCKTGNCNNLLS
jgi:recombinational DNA repair ATPase RecF